MMEITKEFLKEKQACQDGFEWWLKNCEGLEDKEQLLKLTEYRFDWANWVIVRLMNREQKLKYAIFSAEQVIDIYEKKYPENKAPRRSIEAAKVVLGNDTKENRKLARAAASSSYTAAAAAAAALRLKVINYGMKILKVR